MRHPAFLPALVALITWPPRRRAAEEAAPPNRETLEVRRLLAGR